MAVPAPPDRHREPPRGFSKDVLAGHEPVLIREPRQYQIALKNQALERNTIAFLGTGSGKTFICVLLIKDMVADLLLRERDAREAHPAPPSGPTVSLYSYYTKRTSKTFFFLVDRVPLVFQQAQVLEMHTDLRVGKFCGEMGVDFWDIERWRKQFASFDIIVMTAQIMLNILRHGFISLNECALLIFDECHHALGAHPFNCIMQEFYFAPWTVVADRPRIFGMTASPVKAGLKRTNDDVYTASIETLERNLDCKIAMLPEELVEEVERYVPRPKEFYVRYDPPDTPDVGVPWLAEAAAWAPGAILAETELVRHELGDVPAIDHLDRRLAALLDFASAPPMEDTPSPTQHDTADLLAAEAPPPVSKKAANIATAETIQGHRDTLAGHRAGVAGGVSPKLRKLQALMLEQARASSSRFRALVFVERRFIAKCVYLALRGSRELQGLGVSAGLVVGHGNGAGDPFADDVAMGFREQNAALAAFRAGETNVLVCTSVVEEGLDVPECELVALFDGVSSMTGYVQSRGRARHQTSKYVVFVRAGSDDEMQLRTVHYGERLMEVTVGERRQRANDDEEEREPEAPWGKVFRVVSTGAIATHLSAVSLLSHYCTCLPHDIFCTFRPDYAVESNAEGQLRSKVTLPPTAAVTEACGEWVGTRRRAAQSAALQAVVALYEANALTDHLIPNVGQTNNTKFRRRMRRPQCYIEDELVLKDDDDGSDARWIRCVHGVARVLRDPPAIDGDGVAHMHLYTVEVQKEIPPDPADAASTEPWGHTGVVVPLQPLGLLFAAALHHTPPPLVHYARPYGRLQTTLAYRGVVPLHRAAHGMATAFQRLWGRVGVCAFWVRGEMEDEETPPDMPAGPILATAPPPALAANRDGVVPAVEAQRAMTDTPATQGTPAEQKAPAKAVRVPKSYLILPLHRGDDAIDWDTVERTLAAAETPPVPITQTAWEPSARHVPGSAELDDFMACTGHAVATLPPALRSAVASPDAETVVPHRVLRVQSGMLEVTPVARRPPDLHHPTRTDTDVLPPRLLVAPDAVTLLPVPASVALQEAALCLPSVMTDMERWALVDELRESVGTEIGDRMLVQALTSAASHSTANYEKLETFGDTLLKFVVSLHVFLHHPSKHQGQLTVLKEYLITNRALVRAVLRRNLAPFLSVLPASAADWTPGVCTTHEATMKSKELADTLEALVGAVFLSADEAYVEESASLDFRLPSTRRRQESDTAMRPTKRFRAQPGIADAVGAVSQFLAWAGVLPPEEDRVTVDDYLRRFVAQPPHTPRLQKLALLLAPVQGAIGYRFRNPALLVEAFLHGSVSDAPTPCYQRLEFLGDAALDFFITRYLWLEYPDISPGEATDMRQNLCTNEHFARVVAESGLHRYILHHAPSLMGAISDALGQLERIKERERGGEAVDLFEFTAPKVMGDVLESLAAAVLLDGGVDVFFDVFWRLLKPHMIPSDHITLAPLRRVMRRARGLAGSAKSIRFEVEEKEERADNRNRVVVGMYFRDRLIATGEARNQRLARRLSAINGLQVEDWSDTVGAGGFAAAAGLGTVFADGGAGGPVVHVLPTPADDSVMHSGWD